MPQDGTDWFRGPWSRPAPQPGRALPWPQVRSGLLRAFLQTSCWPAALSCSWAVLMCFVWNCGYEMLWLRDSDIELLDLDRFDFPMLYAMAVCLLKVWAKPYKQNMKPRLPKSTKSWHLLFVAEWGEFLSKGRMPWLWDTHRAQADGSLSEFLLLCNSQCATEAASLRALPAPCASYRSLLPTTGEPNAAAPFTCTWALDTHVWTLQVSPVGL